VYLDVQHRVWLEYDGFIRESVIELRLQPKTTPHQSLSAFVLSVGPPTKVHRYLDWSDNVVHHLSISKFHDRVEVQSRSLVNTHPTHPPLASLVEPVPFPDLPHEHYDYLQVEGPLGPSTLLTKFNRALAVPKDAPLGQQVRAISRAMRQRVRYQRNVTRYDSTTEDFLAAGAGVCQDFTHLMLAVLRLRRIPCRYVSGYLHVERRTTEPAQSHAWVEFFSPARGWIPFDPTHDREIDERYVIVAHGRHYHDVPPNRGTYRGTAKETLHAEVQTTISSHKAVSALHEEIRHIDLPVYREIPARPAERTLTALEAAAAQQQ
jgi:transglutaminase-like putative cysteine protease